MTAEERLIHQGFLEGFHPGFLQGFQQGQRALLLRLLRKRFGGQVDSDIEPRLATASIEQIATWAERVLSAATLPELLAD